MKLSSVLISSLVAAAALVGPATSAYAQQKILIVAATGTNGTCTSLADACTSIAGAMDKVTDDGSIIQCVGPVVGGLGFLISKSVTIDCASGANAINAQVVAISAPGKTVILKNLGVNCFSNCPTSAAIDIIAAANVSLENVSVGGVPAGKFGIYDHRTGPGYLVITNSSIVGNAGPGIVVVPNGGNIGVVLDNVRSNNNTYGLGIGAGGRVMIKRSVFSANSVAGIQADTGAIVAVNETLISHNSTGIAALNGSSVAVSNSDIDSNNTAFNGSWASFGNNRLFANLGSGTAPTAVGTATSDLGQR